MKAPSAGGHFLDGALRLLVADALFPLSGLVTSAVLSRRLGVAGYGRFALAATVIATVEWLLTAFLSRATIKAVGESEAWEPAGNAALRLHTTLSVAAGLGLVALAPVLAGLFGERALTPELRLFALDVPLFGLAQAHANLLIARGRFRDRARARALRWCTRLVLIVVFVEAGFSVTGAILGSLGATLVELLAGRAAIQPSFSGAASALPTARLWSYSVPLFLSGLGSRILGLDLVVLKALGASATDAGLYGAALSLSILPGLLALTISPLLLSSLVRLQRAARHEEGRRLARAAQRGALLVVPFAAASLGARHEVVALIFGSAFLGSATLLVPLIAAGLALLVISVSIAILTAEGRIRSTAALTLPMPFLAVAGYAIVVPRAGAFGAACVSAAVTGLGCAVTLAVTRRLAGVGPGVATALRVAAVSAAAWALSAALPGAGLYVLPRLALAFLACVAALLVLGEWPREQRVELLAALRSVA